MRCSRGKIITFPVEKCHILNIIRGRREIKSHQNRFKSCLAKTSSTTTTAITATSHLLSSVSGKDEKKELYFNQHQARCMSSMTDFLPDLPEAVKQYSIWGGSGIILKAFHAQGVPYWGCMSLTNVMVRTSLLPLVIKGAKTSAKFSNVAPEVQFLISSYIRDANKLKDGNAPPSQRLELLVAAWKTLKGIWRLNGVNPFDVMKSPLMQIPVFWYFSVDIRKLINGGDPEMAQELTDSGFFWITDLTEPDPWFGLPILSGLLLYLNVEFAIGKKSLSGETASKSNLAKYMKDGFQSLAVFMPCFVSQSPAGVQIYLLTSFTFTLFQGAALRDDAFRTFFGLPLRNAPPPEGKYVKEFIHLHKIDRETYGVLAPTAQNSYRPHAQMFSEEDLEMLESASKKKKQQSPNLYPGVLAPNFQPLFEPSPAYLIVNQLKNMSKIEKQNSVQKKKSSYDELPGIDRSPDEIMEYSNRGEIAPAPIKFAPEEKVAESTNKPVNIKSLKKKKKKKKLSRRKK